MDTWRRRMGYSLVGLVVVMFGYALVYDYGMGAIEGEPITFLHSLQVVVETFTTTGFGSDAPWETPAMNLLVIAMDLTGVALIFLALPVLAFPLLQEALEAGVPTAVDDDLEDHVVICTFSPRGEALIAALDSWDVGYAVVEPDRERAKTLHQSGYTVVHADPETGEGLRGGRLESARALVADASDQVNTSVVLAAREVDPSVRIVSVVGEPDHARYHRLAGADTVLSPRELLGERLASKVTTGLSTDLGGVEIGDDFEIAELPIHRGSDLVGRTLGDSGLREQTGVNVIGAWFQGRFVSPPSPDARLDEGTILLVTGRESSLERLQAATLSGRERLEQGRTIVAGYGEVGTAVADALTAAGVSHAVIDQREIPGIDIVGDATDPGDLREAGIADAGTVVLALPDDTVAEFATLVIRDLSSTVEILVRTQDADSVQKMYRAGADYVLSLATVSGRMVASTILEEEEVLSPDTQVEIVRTQASELVGRTLGGAQVRSETGCTVVGVDRDGEVLVDVGPEFRIEEDDTLIVAGTDEGTNRFIELLK